MDREKLIMKLDNFWYHYKVYVLVGLAVVAATFYVSTTWEGSKDVALSVVIAGSNVEKEERTSLQETATKTLLSNDTNSIIKQDFWLVSSGLSSGKHADLQGKFMAMVSGGTVDIVIMDTNAFHLYAEMGTFLKLEPLEVRFPDGIEYVTAEGKYDNQNHTYGIKMDDNLRLKQVGFNAEDKVLAVIENTEDPKLSSEWINWILEK